ncbi:hypothetical protein ACLTEW_11725 [Gordonia lacunae]|uniref:Uncharacterized protein n=1 Tax=Gordonia lacunae TaxID=417102 RepID=A0A243Q3D4_9ACTN|nr:hypothetical protein [Gordonia lacunae]OUC75811.1 hypothetical protein CA982_24835 [Gordonia lacunae]
MRISSARTVAAVHRAQRIDEQLVAAGWSTTGLTDFCPACTVDATSDSVRPPDLRIVRDQ